MTIILQITAALISAVSDEGQRTELGQKYDAMRGFSSLDPNIDIL